MNVLVACEESQEVCKAFRELGHEAYSADIQPCSGGHPEWHYKGDVLNLMNPCWICSIDPDIPDEMFGEFQTQDGKLHELPPRWDLIIAHPPCTYLSNAGACRLYPQKGKIDWNRYDKGMKASKFFAEFYLYEKCDKICIENPIPSKVFRLPPYTQTIQPYQFGEPYSKKTCLWLKGLPKLEPTDVLTEYKPYVSCGTSRNKGNPDKAGFSRKGGAAKVRSKTFPGIARAMAAQWGGL